MNRAAASPTLLAGLVAETERISLDVIETTERSARLAYGLAITDPYARPLAACRLHWARDDSDTAWTRLFAACDELAQRGLATVALALFESVRVRCAVAIDLASAQILSEQAPAWAYSQSYPWRDAS